MLTITSPYVQIADLNGDPLDDGSIYIGTAGLNAETNPITVYWDAAGTQPAAQPIKTRSGVVARNGSPARVYVNAGAYSITVRDKMGRLLASELSISSSVDASGITDGTIAEVKLDAALAAKINGALQKTGGTMTGAIVLPGNATNALEAVPKQQAESIAATAVSDRVRFTDSGTITTTTGTAIDFTGIPAWAKRLTLNVSGVSTNGSSFVIVQLGTSGGVETSGYSGTTSYYIGGSNGAVASISAGFPIYISGPSAERFGTIVFTKVSDHVWLANGQVVLGPPTASWLAGQKVLPGALDRLRVTTENGTNAFDGGAVSLLIEG